MNWLKKRDFKTDGKGTITEYKGKDTVITIPSKIGFKTIFAIRRMAFAFRLITSVTIPNSIKSIGDLAFAACIFLTDVTLPDNLNHYGDGAFSNCVRLTAINVNSANTAFCSENGVLYNKNKTTLLQYPSGKTGAFTIPASVTSIGKFALGTYANPTSVTFCGTIPSKNFWFDDNPKYSMSLGNLREKFYETDPENGTPGTYTRKWGEEIWTRQ